MTITDIRQSFAMLQVLRQEHTALGLRWNNSQCEFEKEDLGKQLYISHYKIWQHEFRLRKMMNEVLIDEPVLDSRFQIHLPPLSNGHYAVVKQVVERFLNVRITKEKHPVGYEFSYDHPTLSINILAERTNLRSVKAAKSIANDLVAYSTVAKCILNFKSQALRPVHTIKPLSVAQGLGDYEMATAC